MQEFTLVETDADGVEHDIIVQNRLPYELTLFQADKKTKILVAEAHKPSVRLDEKITPLPMSIVIGDTRVNETVVVRVEYTEPADEAARLPPPEPGRGYIVTNIIPAHYPGYKHLYGVDAGSGAVRDPVTNVMLGTTRLLRFQ